MRSRAGCRVFWALGLAAVLLASRWALAPRYLITFDEINFALAVENFNPALHQPQPPGDPLFVMLLKLLSHATSDVETLFLSAALLVSFAAVVLIWALGESLLGGAGGIIAALLLLFNPAFWLAALTNPVRLCYAAGATGVALALFQALRKHSERWFLVAAALLGVASGFRPTLAIILAPLALWTGLRIRLGWQAAARAAFLFLLFVATWLPELAAAAGGWIPFGKLLRSYSYGETRATSILFGAPLGPAAHMAWEALVWSCLGALSWTWAIPWLARRNRGIGLDALTGRFLSFWFIPGLLFYATFHVGDADHTLSIIPAVCLTGAAVLVSLGHEFPKQTGAVAALAVALNVFLFFKPISQTAKASTYKPVRWLDGYMANLLDTVSDLQKQDKVTAIFYSSITGWRNLSYYFPEVQIIVVKAQDSRLPTGWLFRHKRAQEWSSKDGLIRVPSCGLLVWVDPDARPKTTADGPAMRWRYPVSFTRASPGRVFDFRGFRFVAAPGDCSAAPYSGTRGERP